MESRERQATIQWLAGFLILVLISMIAYVWVDREARLSAIEARITARDHAWQEARYTLHERILNLEHDLATLTARVRAMDRAE